MTGQERAALQGKLLETMLASMLGLVQLQLLELPKDEALALLSKVEDGSHSLRFLLNATGHGAHLEAALGGPDGSPLWELLALDIVPGATAPTQPGQAPRAMLSEMFSALSGSGLASAVPFDVRAWWLASIRAMVLKGGSFEQHAGLIGRGQTSLASSLDMQNRDEALMRALQAVADDDAELSLWDRCSRLGPLIKDFARQDWRQTFRDEHAPAGWPAWKMALFDAARAAPGSTRKDPKLPVSAQRLHKIATTSNGPFSRSSPEATVLAQLRKPGRRDPQQALDPL